LKRRAEGLKLRGDEVLSEFPGHLAQAAAEAQGSLLVVIGGDGTVNEVANGVAGTEAEIAVLSSGTGQDFARTHGIPNNFDDAVRVALRGETRVIDLGRVELDDGTTRFFANVGSAGMSGSVAQRANAMTKRFGGRATFFYALTREFLAWQNTRVVVELEDGARREGLLHDVIVANGNYHGGGMKLAPDAGQDDGLFDVVTIGDVSKLDFLTTAPKLYSGRYLAHPKVELLRSASVAISADEPLPLEVDGEPIGTTPARFEVVPAALRLRVPAA